MRLLIAVLIIVSSWIAPRLEALEIKDGAIDLSQWDGVSPISLNGTWMSIENELVESLPLDTSSMVPIPVPTPDDFKTHAETNLYQRTYVLRIKGLRIARPVSLWFENMAIRSHRFLFIHEDTGHLHDLGQLGKVDPDPQQRLHVFSGSNAFPLPSVEGNGTLLIQSNAYPFYSSMVHPYRIGYPIEMGPASKLVKKAQFHVYEESFTIGLFALMALFNLALFIQRPSEKGSLYLFGLSCFFAWRYISTDGYLSRILEPSASAFQWSIIGLTFSTLIAGLCLALFLRTTYPRQVSFLLPGSFIAALIFMLIASLATSVYYVQSKWVYMAWTSIVLSLWTCYLSLRTALAGEEGAVLGLWGMGAVFLGHLNDYLVFTDVYQSVFLGQYSFILLIFMQSLVVGRRFALTFERAVILGSELQQKNAALVQQQTEIQSLNSSLKDYAETLEQRVEEKTRDIVSILNNIRQGIMAVNSPTGELAKEHSRYLETMLGLKKTEGLNVLDACFVGFDISDDQLDQLRNALTMIVGEDALAFEMNQNALPTELKRNGPLGVQIFELDWSPVMAGTRIEKLLLVMRDVTEIKRLRLEAEDQASELKLIADIINVPKERFEGLMVATERLIESNRDLLVRLEILDDGSVDRLYRNLHTVKGMMRSYQLREITEIVHTAENRYRAIKGGASVEASLLLEDLEHILNLVHKMTNINRHKLGRASIQDHHYILIDKLQFEENLRNIREIDFQVLQADDQSRFERIRTLFYKVAYTPLSKLLEAQIEGLSHLARSLNKNPPLTRFIDQGFSINREIHETINNIFTHLLRNSIDHGLEPREVRAACGKPPAGLITFKLSPFHDQLRIEYFDDGGGIDLHKIRQKAMERRLLSPEQEVTHQQLVDFILQTGFSTSDRVTDISGRGMGMDAVRTFIEDIDGTFEICVDEPNSTVLKPIPAHFVIILPENHFQKIEAPISNPTAQVA